MLFHSADFVLFLAVVLPLYYALAREWQNRLLLVASYWFYASWNWHFLFLLVASTTVDYLCALAIDRSPSQVARRRWLLLTLVVNLGFLGFFKYYGFFVDSFTAFLSAFGLHPSTPVLQVVLPVGISFYTFQSISYSIDVYRRRIAPTTDFVAFALYVSYFPHLVAGPIQRAEHLLTQLRTERRVDRAKFASACQLILLGYFRKVFIADGVAPYVDAAFANPAALGAPQLWIGLYLFALQIYGDFAGYTDIARGVSRLMGIELTLNFRQPYLSPNITEFWRRWHIALSSFLRDYLYIPLGGNRAGTARTYANLMVTMLLGGLWHGASWTFVVWGGLHGVYLGVHRALTNRRGEGGTDGLVVRALKIVATFHLVCIAWIFFRAESLSRALDYLAGLGTSWTACPADLLQTAAFYLTLSFLVDLACESRGREVPFDEWWPAWRRGLVYAGMIALLGFVGEPNARPFIYFQF